MKKSLIFVSFIVCLLFFNISCVSKAEKILTQKEIKTHQSAMKVCSWVWEDNQKKNECFENFCNSISLEKKIAQLFVINLDGNENFRTFESFYDITKNESQKNEPLIAGGYLFFSYNIAENPLSQMKFNQSVKNTAVLAGQIPPYLTVDQEGGLVNRLKNLNGPLPSNQRVSSLLTEEKAFEIYSLQAKQMKLLGFDMNLAPVVEVLTLQNQDFLGDRSFGNEEMVQKYGKTCIQAYENNHINTVIKHFPGNSNTDPHTGLPEIRDTMDSLNKTITSFSKVLEANPSAVLMSHARTSEVDGECPACLSKVWVTDILRNRMNYKGLIFSDDIFMGALKKNGYPPEKAVILAIDAGIDCIMISEKRFSKPAAVLYEKAEKDQAFEQKIDLAFRRILHYKIDSGILEYRETGNAYKLFPAALLDAEENSGKFETVRQQNNQLYMDYFYGK